MEDSFINKIKECRCIAVIGMPAAGKTYVTNKIVERFKPNATVVHTDDFIDDEADLLYTLNLAFSSREDKHIIIEGCEVYDMIDQIKPNMIIEVKASDEEINARYKERNKVRPEGFEKHLTHKWNNYVDSYVSNKRVMPYVVPVTSKEFDA